MVDLVDMVQDNICTFPDDTVVQETNNQTLMISEQDLELENQQHDQQDNNGFYFMPFL